MDTIDRMLKSDLRYMVSRCDVAEMSVAVAEETLAAWAKEKKQSDLAKRAGITAQYLNDLVNGKRRLNKLTAKLLMEAL